MRILITGGTGLVGSKLIETLTLRGYDDLVLLTRNKKSAKTKTTLPIDIFEWNPDEGTIESGALEGVDIVYHLAGESVADGRWSKAKKQRILNSRVKGTKLLIETIKKLKVPPRKFISASAVGIYGESGEDKIFETSKLGTGFLAEVCKEWESTSLNHELEGMKNHFIRVGIVLSKEGGALQKMLPAFKAGVAGKLGNGDQYMSWVHIDDLIGQFIFLMENECEANVFNGVSPRPVSNYIFTKILGRELNRPTVFPVPGFVLKTLFGEMSEILLEGQKVIPKNFMDVGYEFKFRSLKEALRDILKHEVKGENELKRYQWVSKTPEQVFSFFSNEKNLEKLTPEFLNFKVLGKSTKELGAGTIIDYKLRLHGIPLKWKSEITEFESGKYFIDEQVKGPYSKWTHLHRFIPHKGGTLLEDRVIYKAPLGVLGDVFSGSFIKRDINKIFKYRFKIIKEMFS
ncbi:MAG: TIGR01777 family oxidoreductase [Bacteriovoracaceae bacterium]|nr:TIGR01777 family oxidoreductase [Bacteriovoracaceae bacterium]